MIADERWKMKCLEIPFQIDLCIIDHICMSLIVILLPAIFPFSCSNWIWNCELPNRQIYTNTPIFQLQTARKKNHSRYHLKQNQLRRCRFYIYSSKCDWNQNQNLFNAWRIFYGTLKSTYTCIFNAKHITFIRIGNSRAHVL